MKKAGLGILAIFLIVSCTVNTGKDDYRHWKVKMEVLSADQDLPTENVAVKDPSIVFAAGNYHLFYTAKSVSQGPGGARYGIGCRYRSASSVSKLQQAVGISIDSMAGCTVIAPQVFYFSPQEKWYLVGHTAVEQGKLNRLEPVYLTNEDISDPTGWSAAKTIKTGKKDQTFWIDFWVICDDRCAYIFYADQAGKLFRVECGLEEFPAGFATCEPQIALEVKEMDGDDPWRFFEAAHIYYLTDREYYLAILEGARPHPSGGKHVDARNRFIFAMSADRLDGEWKRLDGESVSFFAAAENILGTDHGKVEYTQVSHPELIRSAVNERLEISSLCTQMIFQTFDGTAIPDDYNYNALPWKLVLMENCK